MISNFLWACFLLRPCPCSRIKGKNGTRANGIFRISRSTLTTSGFLRALFLFFFFFFFLPFYRTNNVFRIWRWRCNGEEIRQSDQQFSFSVFPFLLSLSLSLLARCYRRIFQRRGGERKGRQAGTSSLSRIWEWTLTQGQTLNAKGVENRSGILHGSFANGIYIFRGTRSCQRRRPHFGALRAEHRT